MTPKILSVDDSRTVRLALARLFRPFACEWREATNGEEGLALATQEKPDLIILDCNMPVMDGVAMLRKVREHAELKRDQIHSFGSDPGIPRCKGSMYATIEPETNVDG